MGPLHICWCFCNYGSNGQQQCSSIDGGWWQYFGHLFKLDAYKRIGLDENALSPTTSPLYGFTGDHIILKGTAKLAIIMGDHPKTWNIIVDFLVVDCPLAINGIIRRPHLKSLKVITSIYHLAMKFPITKGICEVRGCQYDSRECYNKSLKMTEKDSKLPRKIVGMIAVETLKDSR